MQALEVFISNTNLAFLYKIDIEGFKKISAKIYLSPIGTELTIQTIYGLEGSCLFHSAVQTCIEWEILKLNFLSYSTSVFDLIHL